MNRKWERWFLESKREKASDSLDACIKRKESISFVFERLGPFPAQSVMHLEFFKLIRAKCSRSARAGLVGKIKVTQLSKTAGEQLWKRNRQGTWHPCGAELTLPHDTTGLMETSQLALKITCLSAPSIVAAARFWFSGGNCQNSGWSVKSHGFF